MVEMRIARLRALTQIFTTPIKIRNNVEMRVARLRALTHRTIDGLFQKGGLRRNEGRPTKGLMIFHIVARIESAVLLLTGSTALFLIFT